MIYGIHSFKGGRNICIGYEKWKNNNHKLQPKSGIPELCMLDIKPGEEIINDKKIVKMYESLSINDYFFYLVLYIMTQPPNISQ